MCGCQLAGCVCITQRGRCQRGQSRSRSWTCLPAAQPDTHKHVTVTRCMQASRVLHEKGAEMHVRRHMNTQQLCFRPCEAHAHARQIGN